MIPQELLDMGFQALVYQLYLVLHLNHLRIQLLARLQYIYGIQGQTH